MNAPANNPVAGGVTITLDRERVMILDFNAMVLIEEQTGKSTMDPAFWASFPATAKDLVVFLWAALKQDDPDLTLEQAGALINSANVGDLTAALNATKAESLVSAGDGEVADPPAGGDVDESGEAPGK